MHKQREGTSQDHSLLILTDVTITCTGSPGSRREPCRMLPHCLPQWIDSVLWKVLFEPKQKHASIVEKSSRSLINIGSRQEKTR